MAKTQLDLSFVVTSPEFKQTITIKRDNGGKWFQGKYVSEYDIIKTVGVVSATDSRDLAMIEYGDKISETKTIHTIIPVYTSRLNRKADIVVWNGEKYKVINVQNSGDYGYYKAIISLIDQGEDIGG